jgi:hydrogenase maturation protein HypF
MPIRSIGAFTPSRWPARPAGPGSDWHGGGQRIVGNEPALAAALPRCATGEIVAVRGVGGYHLLCDAANESAVMRLRARKGRPAKPLAVMVPWRGCDGLDYARCLGTCRRSRPPRCADAVRPIVLDRARAQAPLAAAVAPGLRDLALMLPYSPLHHLLLEDFGARWSRRPRI